MNDFVHTLTALPTARQPGCPFDPPKELIDAREHGPISHLPFPDGHQGRLITGYDLVRSVLADPRFSSRR
ncbi:cytochrome P450, partial [Streptosporangium canum]